MNPPFPPSDRLPSPDRPDADPEADRVEDRLRSWLAAVLAEAEAAEDEAAEDAAAEAREPVASNGKVGLAASEEALLREVARAEAACGATSDDEATRPASARGLPSSLRSLWADVGGAVGDVEQGATGPSPAVSAAVVAAFDRLADAEHAVVREDRRVAVEHEAVRRPVDPERVTAARSPWRPWAAAAALLLAVGAVFTLRGRDAEAGLYVEAIYRVDLAHGATSYESSRTAGFGELFAPGPESLLAVGFSGSSKVVLANGDAARVVKAPNGLGMLALERGAANLAADGSPISVRVGPHGVLVVERGFARVEASSGIPDVAVAEGASARFLRANGPAVHLSGPTRVRVDREGVESLGAPQRSAFKDLAFFGGAPRRVTADLWLPARMWRLAAGAAARVEGRLAWPATRAVTLAWRPDPSAQSARTLRLALRGPAGLSVAVQGFPQARAVLAPASDVVEPGLATIEIPLPEGWFAALMDGAGDGEMVLSIAPPPPAEAPAGTQPAASVGQARFDGATLARDD